MTTDVATRTCARSVEALASPWRVGRLARLWFAPVCVAMSCLFVGCASGYEHRRGDTVDVSGYPADVQSAYRVFAARCSRCHTLARPLNARIRDPQHWVRYVTRMRRQPGSGIDHTNADIILRFLLYYTNDLQHGEGAELAADPQPVQDVVSDERTPGVVDAEHRAPSAAPQTPSTSDDEMPTRRDDEAPVE